MSGDVLSLLSMLLAVVVVLVLAYLFTRHVAGRGLGGLGAGSGRQRMKILEQLPVGRDQKLAVVQVGTRWFLLGLTPTGITNLAELTAEEATLWQSSEEGSTPPSFREAFLQQLGKKTQGR